ncbi:MAG: hypothetical protein IPK80_01600 [Nannocystis sp.]|nr:hypothetical protein [Nannocystis sp.]
MNDDIMIHNPMNPDTSRELQRRICHVLGISPEDLALLRALSDRMVRVENGCTTVTRRCDDLQNVLRQACCPRQHALLADPDQREQPQGPGEHRHPGHRPR